jgi:hypothetical protein
VCLRRFGTRSNNQPTPGHPPLEGGSKNSSAARYFSGRGTAATIPRPEILFSLSLKDNFDPPSRGGWQEISTRTNTPEYGTSTNGPLYGNVQCNRRGNVGAGTTILTLEVQSTRPLRACRKILSATKNFWGGCCINNTPPRNSLFAVAQRQFRPARKGRVEKFGLLCLFASGKRQTSICSSQ